MVEITDRGAGAAPASELADGRPAPSTLTDVMVLDPAEVAGATGPGPLVCPLELRARSAAALVSFLADAEPALRASVLEAGGVTAQTARSRAGAALGRLTKAAVHVLSTTWTVPLPWFALVDPDQRRLELGESRDDPGARCPGAWRCRTRCTGRRGTGTRGEHPRRLRTDPDSCRTRTVAGELPSGSAVELDYGGLVQLIPDPLLESDTSAEEVHNILEALRSGNVEQLAELFNDLRGYWSDLAAREHCN